MTEPTQRLIKMWAVVGSGSDLVLLAAQPKEIITERMKARKPAPHKHTAPKPRATLPAAALFFIVGAFR